MTLTALRKIGKCPTCRQRFSDNPHHQDQQNDKCLTNAHGGRGGEKVWARLVVFEPNLVDVLVISYTY